jgi:hypothetical protein
MPWLPPAPQPISSKTILAKTYNLCYYVLVLTNTESSIKSMTKIHIKQISQLQSIAVILQGRQLAYATSYSPNEHAAPPDLPDLQ